MAEFIHISTYRQRLQDRRRFLTSLDKGNKKGKILFSSAGVPKFMISTRMKRDLVFKPQLALGHLSSSADPIFISDLTLSTLILLCRVNVCHSFCLNLEVLFLCIPQCSSQLCWECKSYSNKTSEVNNVMFQQPVAINGSSVSPALERKCLLSGTLARPGSQGAVPQRRSFPFPRTAARPPQPFRRGHCATCSISTWPLLLAFSGAPYTRQSPCVTLSAITGNVCQICHRRSWLYSTRGLQRALSQRALPRGCSCSGHRTGQCHGPPLPQATVGLTRIPSVLPSSKVCFPAPVHVHVQSIRSENSLYRELVGAFDLLQCCSVTGSI